MGLNAPHEGAPVCRVSGKDRLTKNAAKSLAKRMEKRGQHVYAYKCRGCRGWHVGNRK